VVITVRKAQGEKAGVGANVRQRRNPVERKLRYKVIQS
jgi:hypothetical protein